MKIKKINHFLDLLFYRVFAHKGTASITFFKKDYERMNEIDFDAKEFEEFLAMVPTFQQEMKEASEKSIKKDEDE